MDLLEWLAADDRRCHDPRLAGPLGAIDDACSGGTAPRVSPPRTIVRVRSIGEAMRVRPELREARLTEILRILPGGAALADRSPWASQRRLGDRLGR